MARSTATIVDPRTVSPDAALMCWIGLEALAVSLTPEQLGLDIVRSDVVARRACGSTFSTIDGDQCSANEIVVPAVAGRAWRECR